MKKQNLLLFLALSCLPILLFSQSQIPNQGFEQWTNATNPKTWKTINGLIFPDIAVERTDSAHSGTYAIKLETVLHLGQKVPGVISLGTINVGSVSGGINFTDHPDSISFWIKHPSAGDSVLIAAEFLKNGQRIGAGVWATTDSIPHYTRISVPILWTSADTCEKLIITALTDPDIEGSKLFLDDFEFTYSYVGITETAKDIFTLFPNPSSGNIQMNLNAKCDKIQVIDMQGKIVFETIPQTENIRLNLNHLSKGVYFIRSQNRTGSQTQRMILK